MLKYLRQKTLTEMTETPQAAFTASKKAAGGTPTVSELPL